MRRCHPSMRGVTRFVLPPCATPLGKRTFRSTTGHTKLNGAQFAPPTCGLRRSIKSFSRYRSCGSPIRAGRPQRRGGLIQAKTGFTCPRRWWAPPLRPVAKTPATAAAPSPRSERTTASKLRPIGVGSSLIRPTSRCECGESAVARHRRAGPMPWSIRPGRPADFPAGRGCVGGGGCRKHIIEHQDRGFTMMLGNQPVRRQSKGRPRTSAARLGWHRSEQQAGVQMKLKVIAVRTNRG